MAVEEIVLFYKERRERKGEYKFIWIGLLQFPSVQGDEVVERPLYTYIVLYRIISTCSVEATKSGQKKGGVEMSIYVETGRLYGASGGGGLDGS